MTELNEAGRLVNETKKLLTINSKLRDSIQFIKVDTLDSYISNIVLVDIPQDNISDDKFHFSMKNAVSKLISSENRLITKFLIDNVESNPLNKDKLEKKLLSHYGDTIILLNPELAPLIPNAINIHDNFYFINEIGNYVICIDNKNNAFLIDEHCEIRYTQVKAGIYSYIKLNITNKSGIRIYCLK